MYAISNVKNTAESIPQEHKTALVLTNKRIMVVDDDPQILALLLITLSRPGFLVITANGAANALETLNSVAPTPDLFILDIMMPDMDGLELCRQIRSRPETATTPILIVSARYNPDVVEKALAAGANDYVSKLIPQAQLITRVRALLKADATSLH